MVTRIFSCVLICCLLSCSYSANGSNGSKESESEVKWTKLLDGKSTEGWENPYEWGTVTVKDGEYHFLGNRKFFLTTQKKYADFIFEAEVKLPPEGKANSGFMFRCHKAKNKVWGYQTEVDGSNRRWSGGLYDESRRHWLWPQKKRPDIVKLFNTQPFVRKDWNTYRIECRGEHFKVFVNDQQTLDFMDDLDREGYLGLQHHGEKGQLYKFRNARIKELKKIDLNWETLFEDAVTGWKNVEGYLQATSKEAALTTPKSYKNFELKFDWKTADKEVKGLVSYRGALGQALGYSLSVDSKDKDAKAYMTGSNHQLGRATLAFTRFGKLDNQSRIIVKGNKIEHRINGIKVYEADLSSKEFKKKLSESAFKNVKDFGLKASQIVIQNSSQNILFKNIKVREIR